jgi:predicted  nucleic acid-binding Zn-ribbon protein
LDIKHLPTEASSIKIRIQKAQAVVESLPDVDRSVADQEKEIAQLEERIARLTSVLSDFGKRANMGSSGMQATQAP